MKKHIIILFIFLSDILFLTRIYSQENIPLYLDFNSLYSNTKGYDFKAAQSITFTNGFEYSASGSHSFSANLSPLNLQPYTENIHGGSTGEGLVGATMGNFDITPSGQITYDIPISIPSGTGGMQPSLSITYNSSTKHGLVGYGFELAGFSVINRAPKNLHKHNVIGIVKFDKDDELMLDGNLLIMNSYETNGRFEGRTENNTFSKIYSYGNQADPTRFEVYTKDGIKYEYGLATSSKITSSSVNKTLYWLVDKVSDTKGNYYTITYGKNEEHGEYWPERIDYTGNSSAGLAPYCSVTFEYETATTESNLAYIYGIKTCRYKRLSKISVSYGPDVVKYYDFGYTYNNGSFLLKSVQETASDGEKLNPTTFSWNIVKDPSFGKNSALATNMTGYMTYTGDFDGDGKTDILGYDKLTGKWLLYLNNNFSTNPVSGYLSTNIDSLYVGDFNGDGYDDFICKEKNNGIYSASVRYSQTGENGITWTNTISGNGWRIEFREDFNIIVGDFNGDGLSDVFIYFPKSKKYKFYYSYYNKSDTNQKIKPLSTTSVVELTHDKDWGDIYPLDFDGDGITDLFNVSGTFYEVLSIANSSVLTQITFGNSIKDINNEANIQQGHSAIQIADFNGDGKSDIWAYNPNTAPSLHARIYYSTGKAFVNRGTFGIGSHYQSAIGDFNGDGRADVLAIPFDNRADAPPPAVYCNLPHDSIAFQKIEFDKFGDPQKYRCHIGDFDGDGKTDILFIPKWDISNHANHYHKYQIKREPYNAISGIKDGMGNIIGIDYKSLSNDEVYKRTVTNTSHQLLPANSTYPVSTLGANWNVVSRITKSNGLGGAFAHSYKYEDAMIHRRGRGFLGFKRMIVKDETNNSETISKYEINEIEYLPELKSVEVKVAGKKVSYVENNYELKYYDTPQKIFSNNLVSTIEKKYDFGTQTEYSSIETKMEYDNYGNVKHHKIIYGPNDSIITENIYENNTDKWFLGRLKKATVTTQTPTGVITRTSEFDYDQVSGLLNKEIAERGNVQFSYTKAYVHDQYGNITESTVTPLNTLYGARSQKTVYDNKGRFISEITNNLGFTTRYTKIDQKMGLILEEVDPNGIKTEYIYDSFGNLKFTKTPLGNSQTSVAWATNHDDKPANAAYYTYTESSGNPPVLEFFDILGRSLRRVVIGFDGQKIYTDVVYNTKGQVEKSSEPYFVGATIYWNRNEYDALGRIKKQIYADNTQYEFTYKGLETTSISPLGHIDTRIKNIKGQLIKSIDNLGGEVSYQYHPSGGCMTVTGPRTVISTEFDIMGNRIKLDDPDLGDAYYTYNAFGELVTMSNSTLKAYTYDKGGRLIDRFGDIEAEYVYDTKWKGALSHISYGNRSKQEFFYDAYGRTIEVRETFDNKTYSTYTSYDQFSRIDKIKYPSGFTVRHVYNEYGYLAEIVNDKDGKSYWKANQTNARGQIEQFTLGNNLTTTKTYNPEKGYIQSIKTPGIQDWGYKFNGVGNLIERADYSKKLTESFQYDLLNRLLRTYHKTTLKEEVRYDAAGNMTYKTGIGDNFVYQDGTNRLISVSGGNYKPREWDEIIYNSFNKVAYLKAGNKTLQISYGHDLQRKYASIGTVDTDNPMNNTYDRRYYINNLYEEDHLHTGEIKKRHYIYAGGESVAIFEQSNTVGEELLYLHKDHLGSIQAYSDANGRLVKEFSYNAWGKRRDPATWNYEVELPESFSRYNRGFTGHEHLDFFEIVNMNGRMYDPDLGRFLSPDPFVQAPDYTQGLNRYIYCLNNPLSLVDPSGYSWFSKNWKSLLSAAVGITVSALLTPAGGAAFGMAMAIGTAGGAASALTGALLNGANIGQMAKATVTGAFWGGVSGGFASAGQEITNIAEKVFYHSITQACVEGARGGNALHGLISSAISTAGNTGIVKYGGRIGDVGRIVGAAIVGGTASQLGGGKFANGAVTGAYIMMFNCNNQRKRISKNLGAGLLVKMQRHYQNGGGEDFIIDISSLDLSDFSQEELGLLGMEVGDIRTAKLLHSRRTAFTIAVGSVDMKYEGDNKFSILDNQFDFDIKSEEGFSGRNIATFLGGNLTSAFPAGILSIGITEKYGGAYNVIFKGTVNIPKYKK